MAYLGKREPEIYGTTTAAELDRMLQHAFEHGLCTREEILARCSEPDLRSRPGARRLLRLLE